MQRGGGDLAALTALLRDPRNAAEVAALRDAILRTGEAGHVAAYREVAASAGAAGETEEAGGPASPDAGFGAVVEVEGSDDAGSPAGQQPYGGSDHADGGDKRRTSTGAVVLFLAIQASIIALYATCTEYSEYLNPNSANANTTVAINEQASRDLERLYPFFQDVHVMIFVGFGFLMTFLRKYSYSSVGFNMLAAAVSLQFGILCVGFWHRAVGSGFHQKIQLDVSSLILGDFAAATVLISFGALLGKIGPMQLLVLTMLELPFYALNEAIGVEVYQAVDMGGSMYVHTFGAFFGIGATLVLTDKAELRRLRESKFANLVGSCYNSDMFAMIGTLFLWMYWPSFNAALAVGASRQRVVVNTVLGLCSSCTTAFLCSYLLRRTGRFSMVDIQNATLAGGVAIGGASDLVTNPWAAMVIGVVGGLCSTAGYVYLQDFLEEKLGIHDTCGVLNLHGIPGVIGGVAGAITAAAADDSVYGHAIEEIFPARGGGGRSASTQGCYQAAALSTTVGIALGGGALCGLAVRAASRWLRPPQNGRIFRDNYYWEVEEADEQGELGFGYQASFHMVNNAAVAEDSGAEPAGLAGGRRIAQVLEAPVSKAENKK